MEIKQLDIAEKQKISYCIPTELRDEQIKINLTKVKGRIEPHDLRPDRIALVSFAPSLNETWEELRNFDYIMTCSGAHKFLIERGIIPTYHADLDPRDYKIKILGQPHYSVEYLIASTIHPNYLEALKEYNVKLWHIFANEEEAPSILPRGEHLLTGGSSVGLRLMTLARFMGFTDFHIFGMDGSFKDGKTHTTPHPNAPPQKFETEYKGKKYMTTPSILYVAKETFHELDQLKDVKATFYGEGLVQAMAKDYVPNHKNNAILAFNRPELISKEYIELNHKLHQDNPGYGMGGSKHAKAILEMSKLNKTTSILDYGCGKGMLAKELPFPIWEYDPAIPEKSAAPKPADIVVCTDVLEHIELDKIQFVLDDLKRCVKQVGYFVISTRKAVKTYANGKNTHSIVQGKVWWEKQLTKYFDIGTIIDREKECELHIVVAPKKVVHPDITIAEKGGVKAKFYTPNDTTKWRAKSLFTKEPSTIEWIDAMKPGEILFDVGANIGSYSVYAGVQGVKVYAFEPEAENYALLVKNLNLNDIEPNAFCIAISDKIEAGTLYAGQSGVGGACHSFNEKVGFDLSPRAAEFTQGCIGFPLDTLVASGLPFPQHLKIDVDGLEHKVIAGASHVLVEELKTLLVEVNPSLPQHIKMIETLKGLGFEYDQAQVDRASRKEGAFKGCAEYIFKKKHNTILPVTISDNISNAILETVPFPYLFIENVFPAEMYKGMMSDLNVEYTEIEKTRGTRGYPKRFTGDMTGKYWSIIAEYLTSGSLRKAIIKKFGLKGYFSEDVLLIRDKEGYQITPHTDTPQKVISALFYLAKEEHPGAGTNMYEPKDLDFKCASGRHYPFDKFNKVKSFPYKPNSVLIFKRTDNSFHGVEPSDVVRDVLLYNLRVK